MGRYFAWSGSRRVLALAGALLALLMAVPAHAQAAATIFVSGTVSCQWHAVEGVWVESGGGGSGSADWKAVSAQHTNIATYAAKIQHVTLPTNIRLHVGCGGTRSAWWSDNRTGSTSRAGGALTGSATLNAVCNEPHTVRPAPGDNQRCWFGYASAAAAWAVRHLTGTGAYHAVKGDKVGDNPPVWQSWQGYCLVFAVAGYWTVPASVKPIVTTDARDMYTAYGKAGLLHSASEVPPVGAFAFYPGDTSQGHIGIAVGSGYVVSATGSSPSVRAQKYGTFNAPYKGWAYPTTAFR